MNPGKKRDQRGILLAVLFLVMRMFVPPLLLAIANDLVIFPIYFEMASDRSETRILQRMPDAESCRCW
jgi:hypothetical protein